MIVAHIMGNVPLQPFEGLRDLNIMFQNNDLKDKMSAVLARTWNYLSGLGQEPGWAVWH